MAKSNAILNIIFGADTKQLDRALGGVAKRLRETADNLNGLGQNLSLGLTAPIAAFAGLATKSFVDSAKAIAQVEAAVKSTGGAAGKSVPMPTKPGPVIRMRSVPAVVVKTIGLFPPWPISRKLALVAWVLPYLYICAPHTLSARVSPKRILDVLAVPVEVSQVIT